MSPSFGMSATSSKVALTALCMAAIHISSVSGSAFRGTSPPKVAMLPLLEELEKIVGKDYRSSTESRALQVEDALRATFQAMPKMPDGGVKPDAVRYMVHRYFVDRHGWFVDGLCSGGENVNSTSSPASIFKDQDSDDVQQFFEVRFQEHSFSLHQVAVFTATLESFVRSETRERLEATYGALGLAPTATNATEEQLSGLIEGYMAMYVVGYNYSNISPRIMRNMRKRIIEVYPTWEATKNWSLAVRRELLEARATNVHAEGPSLASFEFSMKILEEIGDRYGHFQNHECMDLKASLLKLETPGTGRVGLDAFYKSALDGNWQFSESVAYLRQLGALDESDPQRPSVVIPNYINAASNCVASSKFYSVCCIDECESLISTLETRIASPEASPQRIIDLVSTLPSPTTQAPRVLGVPLVKRLEEIASHHHGTVPFHGRLFAQWMHHAYPRECSWPHLAGSLNPLTPVEYEKQIGEKLAASEETMRRHISEMASLSQDEIEVPWTGQEELFVARQTMHTATSWIDPRKLVKMMAGSGVIVSVVVTLFRHASAGNKAAFGLPKYANEKYYV